MCSINKGFSLIELVLSLTILSFILAITVTISIYTNSTYNEIKNSSLAYDNTNSIANFISNKLRNATDIVVSSKSTTFNTSGYFGFSLSSNTFSGVTIGSSQTAPNISNIQDVQLSVTSLSSNSYLKIDVSSSNATYTSTTQIILNNLSITYIQTKLTLNTSYSLLNYNIYYK